MKMSRFKPISEVATEPSEVIRIIAERMLKIRPSGEIEYRPYDKNEVCYENTTHGDRMLKGELCVDLFKLYPDATVGSCAYVGTVLEAVHEYDIVLFVTGNIKVIYNDSVIFDYETADKSKADAEGSFAIPMHVLKGENPLLFLCRCSEEGFGFTFMPAAIEKYKWWAKDYLFHSRATVPIKEFFGEEGVAVSKLYSKEEPFDGEYVFPKLPEPSNEIDFSGIYSGEKTGCFAYALTYALEDCVLTLTAKSCAKVFVNGNAQAADGELNLKKGDSVLVKVLKGEKWGFAFSECEKIGIPFLKSSRGRGDRWLLIGTFGDSESMDIAYGPETAIQFKRPYRDFEWNETFWRFQNKNTYLRPYMDTCFYAQWFYPLMVGQFGLLKAGEAIGEHAYTDYFLSSLRTMAEFYDYCFFEKKFFGSPNFLQMGMELTELDSIGSMGMNMAEAYRISPQTDYISCIKTLAEAAMNVIPRFDDGAFHRETTMWADDTYMSCPFIVRLGHVLKDDKYFAECVRQFTGFKKRLYMSDKKIYSHIFFMEENTANRIPWGRGNGWIYNSLSDVLECMPDAAEGKDTLLDMFRDFSIGIKACQDADGLWHQVLDRPDSYSETSATAMFLLGLARGMRNGWISKEEYMQTADKAYMGLLKHKIDDVGNVYDVCMGSSCSMNVQYYMELPPIDNDDHGTGVILSAIAEYLSCKRG